MSLCGCKGKHVIMASFFRVKLVCVLNMVLCGITSCEYVIFVMEFIWISLCATPDIGSSDGCLLIFILLPCFTFIWIPKTWDVQFLDMGCVYYGSASSLSLSLSLSVSVVVFAWASVRKEDDDRVLVQTWFAGVAKNGGIVRIQWERPSYIPVWNGCCVS
ncbi:hypothetical protein CDL12_21703 [Handroanthus impetiginosus]|uniref:Uncharacterized protein n=1 Tax=Handroanthus impetiginosus TaxID=429701 RepID=A0A2G9GKD7_9LAMI|nr:hypothetical protein CDL12_21703 [Handroanthus impetiginosus]